MEIPSFFVIVFTVAVSIWPESKIVEKGGRVLRFDTYTNCEKAMIAAVEKSLITKRFNVCLLYTSPSPRDQRGSRMPSSA